MISSPTIWSASQEPSLEVYLLGLVDFESCLYLQDKLVGEIGDRNDGQGALLMCEHPPLITIGREGSRSHIACDPQELTARQIDVRWLNRGGPCVMHTPGQLALYPIIPLERRGLGLASYRDRLEGAVMDSCGELQVPAWVRPETPGVWCRCGQIAQLGVAVRSWVSYHGMFVNVCPSLDLQKLVHPPEAANRMTSLSAQRVRPTSLHSVRESLMRRVAERLGYTRYHVYTGHPLLRRTKRIVAYA